MNNKLLLNTNAHVHRTAVTGRVHRPVFRSERVPRRPAPTLLLFRTCSPVGLGILILRGGGGDRVVTRHRHGVLIGNWEITWHVHADGIDGDAKTHLIVRYTRVHAHFPVVQCGAALHRVSPLGYWRGDVGAALAGTAATDRVVSDEGCPAVQLNRTCCIRVTFSPKNSFC